MTERLGRINSRAITTNQKEIEYTERGAVQILIIGA